jgi:phosphatidylserine decarboxylase
VLEVIAREGIPFILPTWMALLIAIAVYVVFHSVAMLIAAILLFLIGLFVTYFFRDPRRVPPSGDEFIVSPGDGKVIVVEEVTDPQGNKLTLVSIFLSVFNVHVNRIPVSGKVTSAVHIPGKFLKAFERAAVTENERTEIVIQSPRGKVKFCQVAGIIARRIVCYLRGGETVGCGDRFGLIRFGSRVDLFLESNVSINVKIGDRVKGGESIIGSFK